MRSLHPHYATLYEKLIYNYQYFICYSCPMRLSGTLESTTAALIKWIRTLIGIGPKGH